jgi:hypothetical protein
MKSSIGGVGGGGVVVARKSRKRGRRDSSRFPRVEMSTPGARQKVYFKEEWQLYRYDNYTHVK